MTSTINFKGIVEKKQAYYGNTKAAYDFAVEEYATRRMIEENESILKMAEEHMNERACMVIRARITELKLMIKD